MFRKMWGRDASPLTDPRSVGSSLLVHAAVLVIASVMALSVALPPGETPPRIIHAELGPIDTRAPAEAGGGAPGDLGGQGQAAAMRIAAEAGPRGEAPRDPAEALLADVLPSPTPPDPSGLAPSGPLTTGVGLLPGPGTGGGGGSGGGSGGGIGHGVGPSTEFFGARERAGSFAFVIDRSGSMSDHAALDLAKRELIASLSQLPPDARFGVVFYNLDPIVLSDADGRPGLMRATARNKERIRSLLETIPASGGTDHQEALEAAFALKPEVIYFLTDARLMTRDQAEALQSQAGPIRIQGIEFGLGPDPGTANPLKGLALATGGSYRYIDVSRYRGPSG